MFRLSSCFRLNVAAAFGILFLLPAETASAWSTPASQTHVSLRVLRIQIEAYRQDNGKFPPIERYWEELHVEDIDDSNNPSPPRDSWGRPFVYKVPGIHGEYDLYSIGEDGIDDGGERDDVSLWAKVNDGYYWKSTWPKGRFAIGLGLGLGILCLALFRFFRWQIVVPIAGAIASLGVALGCNWLKHPGKVPSRNFPLSLVGAAAVLVFIVMVSILFARFVIHERSKHVRRK